MTSQQSFLRNQCLRPSHIGVSCCGRTPYLAPTHKCHKHLTHCRQSLTFTIWNRSENTSKSPSSDLYTVLRNCKLPLLTANKIVQNIAIIFTERNVINVHLNYTVTNSPSYTSVGSSSLCERSRKSTSFVHMQQPMAPVTELLLQLFGDLAHGHRMPSTNDRVPFLWQQPWRLDERIAHVQPDSLHVAVWRGLGQIRHWRAHVQPFGGNLKLLLHFRAGEIAYTLGLTQNQLSVSPCVTFSIGCLKMFSSGSSVSSRDWNSVDQHLFDKFSSTFFPHTAHFNQQVSALKLSAHNM